MASKPFYDRVFMHSSEKKAVDDGHKKLMQAIAQFEVICFMALLCIQC
jgi:hypothetical protein